MTSPLLFISHKHADSNIAQVLAEFVETRSNNQIKVHLSSSPDFQGPKFGKNLNAQLREALWNSDVLLLVYTSPDQDWQYCMWECGVATHPMSPDTSIIVFQCGNEAPAPFNDVMRVNAYKSDDIKRFTDQLLRDPNFFTSLKGPLAPSLRDTYVENFSKELHKNLGEVLPQLSDGLSEEWPTWPFMRIELPRSEVDRMTQTAESERPQITLEMVKNFGEVADSDPRAAQLFNQNGLPPRMKFSSLLTLWKNAYPNLDAAWFESCCEQIMMGAARGFPVIRLTSLKQIGGDVEYTPVLSRVRRAPSGRSLQFDFYFYNLADPRAVPVTSRMISIGDFFYKDLGKIAPEKLKLRDLVEELDKLQLNRVPLFNAEAHPLYIVHRSMIDKFIVKQVLAGAEGINPADLTLSHLLADEEMRKVFEDTFVVVKRNATLAEAKSAMIARPGCSDVFVTAGGGRAEPVQGWLTNVDIVRGS
jgi:hypothetical protein